MCIYIYIKPLLFFLSIMNSKKRKVIVLFSLKLRRTNIIDNSQICILSTNNVVGQVECTLLMCVLFFQSKLTCIRKINS